jgi:large subunit ribosomal protein L23
MSRRPGEVILRPVITEKTSTLQYEGTNAGPRARYEDEEREVRPKYTFAVAPDATKIEIRKAVEQLFEVKVLTVRTMNCRGKDRRVGRSVGRRPHWKKAIVEVAEGEMIDLFEGV